MGMATVFEGFFAGDYIQQYQLFTRLSGPIMRSTWRLERLIVSSEGSKEMHCTGRKDDRGAPRRLGFTAA